MIAEEVVKENADFGVALCGTGVGIAVAADKVPGTRVTLVGDVVTVRAARENLNANIVAFGGAILGINFINNIVDEFINTKYNPNPEKEKLIAKIDNLSEMTPNVATNDHIFDEENEKWARGKYRD